MISYTIKDEPSGGDQGDNTENSLSHQAAKKQHKNLGGSIHNINIKQMTPRNVQHTFWFQKKTSPFG